MGPITEAPLLRARNTNQGPPRHRPCDQILTRRWQIRECHFTRDDLVEHARPPLARQLVPDVLAPRAWAVHRMDAEDRHAAQAEDRKSVVKGKSVSVR